MSTRDIQEAIEKSGIEEWGAGYFSLDRRGQVVCFPFGRDSGDPGIPLHDVVNRAAGAGIRTPLIIRFPQIIKGQLVRMHNAFARSIDEFKYTGRHFGVFPFKVNQRREFIDAIVQCGQEFSWGLEVGSKTEFMAALGYPLPKDALFICNGFKDSEFIAMAFLAQKMGRNITLVAEGPDELQLITEEFQRLKCSRQECPQIGLRIRLSSRGSGKWEKSSGETSKFGLTTVELIQALRLIEEANLADKLQMLHFHVGSQITAIKRFKNALREAARVYAKVYHMGFAPNFLNIGGGVGVDYDGSHTSDLSSANYTIQEFTNDAIYVVMEVCRAEGVPYPDVVTESGRVIAAHHSVVVTDIREVQGEESLSAIGGIEIDPDGDGAKSINELRAIVTGMNSKNFNEFYHDAVELHEDLFSLFNLGFISLEERAVGEDLFRQVCLFALNFAAKSHRPSSELDDLEAIKVSKYLANFSIFQSIPDAWSIDQLFPVMPLSRHDERPTLRGTIVDITCDSDGCLESFIDPGEERSYLDLHKPNGQPYYLGFFLVGAYQESLANEHNLFGAINEVEVWQEPRGSWMMEKITAGDTVIELLECRNYSMGELKASYQKQLDECVASERLQVEEANEMFGRLGEYLNAYPYLRERI